MANLPQTADSAIIILDLLADWPYKRVLSKHYAEEIEEFDRWTAPFNLFDSEEVLRTFLAGDASLLFALAYSSRDEKDFIHFGCDFMNWVFAVDKYTDVAGTDIARKVMNGIMKFLDSHYPMSVRPIDVLEEMAQQFWHFALTMASPDDNCFNSFAGKMREYLQVVTNAEKRNSVGHRIQSIIDHCAIRRGTSGAKPSLALFEFGLDLSKDVMQHPVILQLPFDAVEMIWVENDLYSYAWEYHRDRKCNNILTYIMRETNVGLPAAIEWAEAYANTVKERFHHQCSACPILGSSYGCESRVLYNRIRQLGLGK